MEKKFNPINIKKLSDNVFKLLEDDWMLVTAGKPEKFNTMTASWGTFGILWNKPVAIGFIRPQRYTLEFLEQSPYFTLSFFNETYRPALSYCGSHSGKKVDKAKEAGLTPAFTEHNGIYFSEARLVMECKKLYADELKTGNFLFPELIKNIYPNNDFHRFFIAEIVSCTTSDDVIQSSSNEKYNNLDASEI